MNFCHGNMTIYLSYVQCTLIHGVVHSMFDFIYQQPSNVEPVLSGKYEICNVYVFVNWIPVARELRAPFTHAISSVSAQIDQIQ